MKTLHQFLNEASVDKASNYIKQLLNKRNTEWSGSAARGIYDFLKREGNKIGELEHKYDDLSKRMGSTLAVYKMDGEHYLVQLAKDEATHISRYKKHPSTEKFYREKYNFIKEESPANSVGSSPGNVAGVSDNDPPVSNAQSKFAGRDCFEIDSDTFHKCKDGHRYKDRWDKYLNSENESHYKVKEYAKKYPQRDIIIQDEKSGAMSFLKKKGIHY